MSNGTKKKHWREILPSDYLASADLDDGNGGFVTVAVTVTKAYEERVKGENGREDECLLLKLKEYPRPMIINKTNAKTIEDVLRTPYPSDWVGKRLVLGVKPDVRQFGGGVGPGLRFKDYAPKEEAPPITCEQCGNVIKPIKGIAPKIIAEKTREQYGKSLCNSCALKAKEAMQEAEEDQEIAFFEDAEEG